MISNYIIPDRIEDVTGPYWNVPGANVVRAIGLDGRVSLCRLYQLAKLDGLTNDGEKKRLAIRLVGTPLGDGVPDGYFCFIPAQ